MIIYTLMSAFVLGGMIGVSVFGLWSAMSGGHNVESGRKITGIPARFCGLICMLPFPVAYTLRLMFSEPLSQLEMRSGTQVLQWSLVGIDAVVLVVLLIIVNKVGKTVAVTQGV